MTTTHQPGEIDLEPCPFCGGAAKLDRTGNWHDLVVSHVNDCFLSGDAAEMSYLDSPGVRERMASAWNRRARSAPPAGAALSTMADSLSTNPAGAGGDERWTTFSFELDAQKWLGTDHAIGQSSFQKDDDGGYQYASTRRLFDFWKAALARAAHPIGHAGATVAQHIPRNFTTHRAAWREALTFTRDASMGDGAAYWQHELDAYDRAFSRLLDNPEPARAVPASPATGASIDVKRWQDRYAELGAAPNELIAERRKGACRDGEITDLRAQLAQSEESVAQYQQSTHELAEELREIVQRHALAQGAQQGDERAQVVDDLAMLVRRLVRSLRKACPESPIADRALDYLKRKGLTGSPLRTEEPTLTVDAEFAIKFIEKRAQAYADENSSMEPDTGATSWHYGEAGQDYYNTLVELADDIRHAMSASVSEADGSGKGDAAGAGGQHG